MTKAADWSREDEARLSALYAAGIGDLQIALKMGRSESAVRQKRLKMGIAARKSCWPQEDEDELRRMIDEGRSSGFAAKKLGYTRSAVIGKANRLGIHFKGNPAHTIRAQGRKKSSNNFNVRARTFRPPGPSREQLNDLDRVKALHARDAERTDLISIHDLEPTSCRYPVGDAAPYKFCGRKSATGFPYCEEHTQRCVMPAALVRAELTRYRNIAWALERKFGSDKYQVREQSSEIPGNPSIRNVEELEEA